MDIWTYFRKGLSNSNTEYFDAKGSHGAILVSGPFAVYVLLHPLGVLAGAGGVEEVEQGAHEDAARQHRDGPERPEEERQRHVEGAEAQRPGVAAAVHRPGHVRHPLLPRRRRRRRAFSFFILWPGPGREAQEEAGVRVEPDGLHVADEGEHEAEGDGHVLGRERLPRLAPVHPQLQRRG